MIIVGDVQGCYKSLRALLKKCPKDEVCFVGDLIDKGPNSRDVVQFVIDNGYGSVLGNHEKMMLEDGCAFRLNGGWVQCGGMETLHSYKDTDEDEAMFERHCDWIRKLPYYLEFPEIVNDKGQYLFVSHSAIPYDDINMAVVTQEILWGRYNNPKKPKVPYQYKNAFNVFGHSPVRKLMIASYYANIDTGCFHTRPGFGHLTALRFPQMEIYQQENIDQEYGHDLGAKMRYYLLYDDAGNDVVRDFSTKTTALRWLVKNAPQTVCTVIHGEEVSISRDEMTQAREHMKKEGSSWMDYLSKTEWDAWAKENLSAEQRAERLATCWDCTDHKTKPYTPCCYTCGRTADDPVFNGGKKGGPEISKVD